MKFSLLLFFFAISAHFGVCKHMRYTEYNLPKEQIRFGKGGGIVGIEKSYTLLENGQLFEKVVNGGLRGLDDVKKKKAKNLFEKAQALGLAGMNFQYPGNTYSFIEVHKEGGYNRIAWGDNQHPVDPAVEEFYDKLMEHVKPAQ
jgi:hypothetical protein